MKQFALILAALMTAALADRADADGRPVLRVWGCQHHAEAAQFCRDYHADARFAQVLNRRWRIVFVDMHQPLIAGAALANGVTICPTFQPFDRVSRIEGYKGRDWLLQSLDLQRPPALTDQTPPTPPALDALRQELQALHVAADQQRQTTDAMRALLTQALTRQQLTPEEFQRALQQHDPQADTIAAIRAAVAEVQAQLQARSDAPVAPPAPPAVAPAPASDGGPALRAAADDREPAARPSIVLTAAQIAAVVLAGGGSGAVAWAIGRAALGALVSRRRRRQSAQGTPSVPPVAAPHVAQPLPPAAFAPYPVDRISAAYDFARREVVQKFPGSVGTLEHLDALMQQHLSGQQVAPTR